MPKASRKIAPKQTKCPAALLGRALTASIHASHNLTDLVGEEIKALRKADPGLPFSELLRQAESKIGINVREAVHSGERKDTENYASHVRATSIEGALVQLAIAISTIGGVEDAAENAEEKEMAGRVCRNLVSAFHAIEVTHGFNPNSLISQHYVSYFE